MTRPRSVILAELAALIPDPQQRTHPRSRQVDADTYWADHTQRLEDEAAARSEPDGPEQASDLDSYWAGLRAENSDDYWMEVAL